jgi:hypothetical protein
MKQGIYLGRPPARSSLPQTLALAAAAAAALALAFLYQRTRTEVQALASEVRELERSLETSTAETDSEGTRLAVERLRLVLGSGAADALPSTELLHLVESALPEGVLLSRLSFNTAPQPILTLEASTLGGERVTEMERRFRASPLVTTTSLLEERRIPDGRLAVRIQVGLARR